MPPELTDEIEDMTVESSTTVEDVVVDPAKAADATDANSSSATDETEVDTLSVVRDVVEQREESQTEAAPSAEGEEVGDKADGQTQQAEQDDYSDVPFNQHPRFQQVIRERSEFKADSDEYRKITKFLDANGLTPAEASDGIEIMALMKLDPEKAWERLQPRLQNLLIATGRILPDDLQKRVEAKELTREVALEMSRGRAAIAARDAREKFQRERGQQQQADEASASVVTAVAEWEKDRVLKDPNFKAKLPRLQEKIAFLHATEGRPKDAAGAKAQLKRAYDAVNKELPKVVNPTPQPGKKPAITPVRGGQVANNAQTQQPDKPKTTLDIVRAGRQRQSA